MVYKITQNGCVTSRDFYGLSFTTWIYLAVVFQSSDGCHFLLTGLYGIDTVPNETQRGWLVMATTLHFDEWSMSVIALILVVVMGISYVSFLYFAPEPEGYTEDVGEFDFPDMPSFNETRPDTGVIEYETYEVQMGEGWLVDTHDANISVPVGMNLNFINKLATGIASSFADLVDWVMVGDAPRIVGYMMMLLQVALVLILLRSWEVGT